MNLRRLQYFVQVATEGSLGRASRVCGVAQPALTRQIQLLEAELGVALFERRARGVALNETGKRFKEAISDPLKDIEAAINAASSCPGRAVASLILGLPPVASKMLGGRVVRRFQAELPDIALRIVEDDSSSLAAALARRTLDAAVLISFVPEQRVSQAEVMTEPLLLVGSPDALKKLDCPVRFADLVDLALILPCVHSGSRMNLDHVAETAGVKIAPTMVMDSLDVTKTLVRHGEFLTVLPASAFQAEAAQGQLLGLPISEPTPSQRVLWAVKPDWRLPRVVYNQLEKIVIEEWFELVERQAWPGEWTFNSALMSTPFSPRQSRISRD